MTPRGIFASGKSTATGHSPSVTPENGLRGLTAELLEIRELLHQCESEIKAGRARRLPGNAAFLADGRILCRERSRGDSRYPYGTDGFNFWVNASGYMHGNRGLFFLFLPSLDGQEPPITFFAGCRPSGTNPFISSALLPVPFVSEGESRVTNRYTVIGHDASYFVTETPEMHGVVRVFVDQSRPEHAHIIFSVLVQNSTSRPLEVYTSAYMKPFCRHQFVETHEDRWFKKILVEPYSTLASERRERNGDASVVLPPFVITTNEDVDRFHSISNYAILRRAVSARNNSTGEQLRVSIDRGNNVSSTDPADESAVNIVAQESTSRLGYVGSSRRGLNSASFLTTGRLERDVPLTVFNENAIVGDLLRVTLPVDSSLRTDYTFSIPESRDILDLELDRPIGPVDADLALQTVRQRVNQTGDLSITVREPATTDLEANVFNRFIPFLKKQVAVCAMLKGYMNSSPNSLIGFRDVLQAVDGHLYDQPKEARSKILEILNYVLVNGRCPRQYSLPINGSPGRADLRNFIDQGVWAISTVYNYIAVTGDTTLLGEVVGYHQVHASEEGVMSPSRESDSVLEHLLRIMDYMALQRDPETGLVLTLYGDWNDALDGLGTSSDPREQFGTGVSAMTSIQVYQNCAEILELLARFAPGRFGDHVARLEQLRKQLREGLMKHLVVRQGDQRRILHGWGDQRQYFVGSFHDSDGLARDGLTSNAFWVLSNMLQEDPTLREDILAAFERLDSTYGLKTFEPGFAPDAPGVGRITKLPRGTAENGATYVHATTFAIAALFRMGEPEKAWQQITKILPFSSHHHDPSHSPFVMPNSYVENLQLSLTGQSMNDWQTGSSNALLKLLVRHVCGFQPEIDHLRIAPAGWYPFESLELIAMAHGHRIQLVCSHSDVQQRRILLNGEELENTSADELSGILVAEISYSDMASSKINEIIVTDPVE